jgi:DNA-binding MarR family transcriptional regulator
MNVRPSTEAERLRRAFDSVNTVSSEVNAVKALAIMLANPGISGNKIVAQLRIQKSSWSQLRASLEMQHYIACERDDKGHVVRMSVTEHGAEWLASSRLKRHDHRFRGPAESNADRDMRARAPTRIGVAKFLGALRACRHRGATSGIVDAYGHSGSLRPPIKGGT